MTPGNEMPEPVLPLALSSIPAISPSSDAAAAVTLPDAGPYRNGRFRPMRWIALLAACAALFTLTGCGGNSLTNGGVPIGGSRLYGKVVRAGTQNGYPPAGIGNAKVTATVILADGKQTAQQVATDPNGLFSFDALPTGQATSTVQVTVNPNNPAIRSQQISYSVVSTPTNHEHVADLIVALPDASFDLSQVASLTLLPGVSYIRVGDTVAFTGRLLDHDGNVLPLTSTLLFTDSFGTLGSDGTFYGGSQGTGTVTAFWYSLPPQSAQVVVSTGGQPQPPPAPPARPVP